MVLLLAVGSCSLALAMKCALRVEEHIQFQQGAVVNRLVDLSWSVFFQPLMQTKEGIKDKKSDSIVFGAQLI
jgi:hypothetical protein